MWKSSTWDHHAHVSYCLPNRWNLVTNEVHCARAKKAIKLGGRFRPSGLYLHHSFVFYSNSIRIWFYSFLLPIFYGIFPPAGANTVGLYMSIFYTDVGYRFMWNEDVDFPFTCIPIGEHSFFSSLQLTRFSVFLLSPLKNPRRFISSPIKQRMVIRFHTYTVELLSTWLTSSTPRDQGLTFFYFYPPRKKAKMSQWWSEISLFYPRLFFLIFSSIFSLINGQLSR